LDFFAPYILHAVLERRTVNGVPISEERARRGIPGKRLNDLLTGPLRRRVFGDVQMHDTSALVRQHDKHKKDFAAGSWHSEATTRHDVFDVMRVCNKSGSFIGFLGAKIVLSGLEKAFKMRPNRSY